MAHASIGPSCAVARIQGRQVDGLDAHARACSRCAARSRKALGMKPPSIRCIHIEGSGCYGHNGADDVALDAALLARAAPGRPVRRAMDARRRVHLGALRPRHGDAGQGRGRPTAGSSTGTTTSGARATTCGRAIPTASICCRAGIWPIRSRRGRRGRPVAPNGAGDRNAIPTLRLAAAADHASPDQGHAAPHVGAAHARRLRQRVRGGILHGRAGGGGRRRSGRVPAGASEGSARAGRDRGGGRRRRTGSPARRATARAAAASAMPATRPSRPTTP